jgi:amino acid transporter
LPVKSFGETEFILGCTKVLIIITLIISTLVVTLGGGPNGGRIGFRYWNEPGPFASYLLKGDTGRFLGWWACMCQACFAYVGTEVVGMTFGETPNPQKNIPRAVKQTFWRIFCFYVSSALVLGMAIPYNSNRLMDATKKSTSAGMSMVFLATAVGDRI